VKHATTAARPAATRAKPITSSGPGVPPGRCQPAIHHGTTKPIVPGARKKKAVVLIAARTMPHRNSTTVELQ
jgi:hypothetical protein